MPERPKAKVSLRGQEMALRVLNKALEDAEAEDVIPVNPLRKVKSRPRPPKPETRSMTEEQAGAFLTAAAGTPFYPLYLTAIDSGMREGELFALEWSDLDLETGVVAVQRAPWRSWAARCRSPSSRPTAVGGAST